MPNSIYNSISLEVGNILKDVQTGKIGLPDLQRPFVWGNEKVRDLLDSMLRGYPIGYVMLWDSPSDDAGKKSAIGSNQKVYAVPKSLVIDGQQRLTALLSSLYGVPVRDKNFRERTVKIAYDPIARSFKNADASTEKDSRYVPDVSEAFAANHDNKLSAYRRAFIKRLNEANAKKGEPELDDGGEDAVESGLNALLGLERYLLPTLEISESADEETVSDIFVRVNSQGQALKQDDFIMTLLSVYEPAMRERIEEFCAMSHAPAKGTSYNPLMTVSPTHIIRATVGVGFKRGRLRYAYQILRGRDLKTKETTPETRAENFATFGRALDLVLDLNNWHAFINTLAEAGYVCSDQVGSGNALMFCYAFYLIGRYEFGMEPLAVRGLVRRWYFAAAITGLYVGSFESEFEQQLNDVSRLETADEFRAYFDRRLAAIMTDDYFSITLPSSLDANEAAGPTWWGFVAAQVVLGAKVLFSTAPLSQLLLMGSSGSKKALDKHHLFPDNYLKSRGYLSQRSNRGNFTLVDYQNNIYISDDAPSEYVRKYRDSLGEDEYRRNCEEHALPVGFEDLDYEEFLGKRRQLMGGTPATHGVALAAAPWQRSPGSRFVRLRSRRPSPPNGCARWLPEVAIAPPWSPGWASRAGSPSAVVRRSPGSRLLGVGSTGAHLPGLALPWATGSLRAGKIWIPLHGIILPACGGTANRSEVALTEGQKKGPGRLLRPGPNAQSSRPFWFSSALRSSSQNARIAVAIPRSVKRTAMPVERSTAKPSLPPLTFLMPPRDFEGKRYWRLPPLDLASSMPSRLSRRSSSPIRSGQSRMRPTSSILRATATRTRAFSERSACPFRAMSRSALPGCLAWTRELALPRSSCLRPYLSSRVRTVFTRDAAAFRAGPSSSLRPVSRSLRLMPRARRSGRWRPRGSARGAAPSRLPGWGSARPRTPSHSACTAPASSSRR